MKRLLCLAAVLLIHVTRTEASLHSGLLVAYEGERQVFTVQLGSGKEDLVFTNGSDRNQIDALRRLMRLWYMWLPVDSEGVTLMERPKIKVVVDYSGPTPPTRFGPQADAPLTVVLKEWSILLPITLSILSEEKGVEFFVLDDPTVAFGSVLSVAEQKRYVTIDQAAIEECRKKKAKWIARGRDLYHFVTTDLLNKLAKPKQPNQPLQPTPGS